MTTNRNFSVNGAALMLGIKPRTVRQWIKDGKLNAQKYEFSNRWYVSEEEIDRVKKAKGMIA